MILNWSNIFESNKTKRQELFNETLTLLVLYTLMLFTDFVGSADTRYDIGYAYLGIICLYAVVNILVLTTDSCCKVRRIYLHCVNQKCRKKK